MKNKETILKEFDEKYPNTNLYQVQQFYIGNGHTEIRNILISGDIKDFLSKAIDQTKKETREETIKEAIRKIEKIKIAVVKQTGAYKYNSCYEDCIEILNKLKK